SITPTTDLIAQYDIGFQNRATESGSSRWWGAALIAKQKLSEVSSISLRAEKYVDPDQVIVATTTPFGFDTTSASIGYDLDLSSNVKWRSEYRAYWSSEPVLPRASTYDNFSSVLVTSLALTL
ncbi:MAG: hypothetical protein EOP05_06175, partial [Proteobacteria bacterium]